jgi:hypothetical protein
MHPAVKRMRRSSGLLLAMATGLVALPRTAPGTTYTWVPGGTFQGGTLFWSNMLDWSPNGVPGNGIGDVALITNAVALYDLSVPNSLASLTVNMSGGTDAAPSYLELEDGFTLASDTEFVGDSGSGEIEQGNGANTVGSTLILGESTGDTGSYELDGGALFGTGTAAGDGEYVGYGGTGTFIQTGGLNAPVEGLFLGNSTGSSGIYTLGGTGSLWVGGTEYVGYSGTGIFTQTGGTNTASGLYIGYVAGSSGTYNLSGTGSLSGGVTVGDNGTGTFNQSGGALSGLEYVGYNATGTFNQTGGTNTTSSLTLGYGAGSSGVYTLGGTGSLSVTGTEYVGNNGTGTFNQTGGTNLASVVIGYLTGSSGTYNLSGTGSLSASNEYVGDSGTGTFKQTGGTNTGFVYLGFSTGSSGTYTLSGGSLSAPGSASFPTEYVGYSGTGIFNQTGGANTLGGGLGLGYDPGSFGTYNLSGTGSLSVTGESSNENVGGLGTGTFNQTGGTNMAPHLNVNSGTYTLSGGSLSVTNNPPYSYGSETVGSQTGYGGTGIFNQTGGTNTVGNDLLLGSVGSGAGIYNLSGTGSLSVNSLEVVGYNGTGTFNLTGGTNTTEILGVGAGNSGTYSLSGGSLSAGAEYVGYEEGGPGTFNQTGGTNSVSGTLYLGGLSGGSSCTYSLSGSGVLSVTAGVYAGGSSAADASGSLNVSGGQMTVGGTLEVWNSSGTQVTISGGTVSAGNTVNMATITQTGGTASLGALTGTGSISVGNSSGGSASMTVSALNQSSVTINATGTLQVTGGSDNTINTLTMNGGQLDITNTRLFIDYGNGPDPIASIEQWIANGYYNLSGPQIISSAIAADDALSGLSYGIGYADGADGVVAGLPSGEIEIMFTLLGDANLDGTVNAEDFTQFSHNLGQSGPWDDGDFNYDGTVNAEDFTLFSHNLGQSAADAGVLNSANGINLANVPEPASAGMTVIAGLGILRRRRRI